MMQTRIMLQEVDNGWIMTRASTDKFGLGGTVLSTCVFGSFRDAVANLHAHAQEIEPVSEIRGIGDDE